MNISVVIPAYNAEQTISQAIESCLAQTYPAYEIIVVDDASVDQTIDIASSFNNISIIQNKKNSGPSATRNKGWDAATGDIIAFLDSDDTWYNNKLETIKETLKKHSQIDYLGHEYTLTSFSTEGNIQPIKKSFLSILLKNPYQPSCLVVRNIIEERFDETYRYCEDHELSVRVANRHHCYILPTELTKLGRAQLSIGGASENKWKMRQGELKIYSSVYKHNFLLLPVIPLLWVYSLTKMLYRSFK